MLKIRESLVGVVVLVWWLAAGAEDAAQQAAIERGQVAYELYCALCHGDAGEGYVSPKAS